MEKVYCEIDKPGLVDLKSYHSITINLNEPNTKV